MSKKQLYPFFGKLVRREERGFIIVGSEKILVYDYTPVPRRLANSLMRISQCSMVMALIYHPQPGKTCLMSIEWQADSLSRMRIEGRAVKAQVLDADQLAGVFQSIFCDGDGSKIARILPTHDGLEIVMGTRHMPQELGFNGLFFNNDRDRWHLGLITTAVREFRLLRPRCFDGDHPFLLLDGEWPVCFLTAKDDTEGNTPLFCVHMI